VGIFGKAKLREVCQKLISTAPNPPQKTSSSPSGSFIDSKLKSLKLTKLVFWVAKTAIAIDVNQRNR
jgi:hypothetical protein